MSEYRGILRQKHDEEALAHVCYFLADAMVKESEKVKEK